ncbi:winged helix-turn-helix domain-containing protein [Streptomyces sp. NPDC047079]|uniref:winged helix-turn-helix domain-containing protein n=1 Tax=Streptomyces sp. NPDC047079 TaxID=3154607 RepID=UPI0033CCAA67
MSERTPIGKKFPICHSVSGATRLVRRLGFSPQVPARRVVQRDERAVSGWEAIWAEEKAVPLPGDRCGRPGTGRATAARCAGARTARSGDRCRLQPGRHLLRTRGVVVGGWGCLA